MDLFKKAIDMSKIYRENEKVEAIILAGSVSKNLQDEYSDIELHILWSNSPTDEDRQYPIEEVKGTILSYHPYEEEEWSEAYMNQDGIKFEISSFLSTTVDRFIFDVIDRCETDFNKQCILASIDDGISLFGEEIVNGLKNRIAKYPLGLTKQMITENLWLSNRWSNRNALLKRQDWLMLYDVLCGVQKKLFGVLFGLNHMYVNHPAYKWMRFNIERMQIKPENLYDRMTSIMIGDPQNAVQELELLIEEVIVLVEKHNPKLNISEQKKNIGYAK
ncbi:DUF4037 domain-containing protein [Virgibacillus sp. AGTR]|uniref:DUF4037 domain-containing protein n=1 Tax=unclassified Virgibacillus TaxID=2620237 RepID=UPI001D162EA4|nr:MULTISPECIES: DUF4037 domain-containing protein [unclassified Virgibacillus]MCC2250460.1 DUF4037 domain-containing protein [Virgibacillus sp. AGTR]MDY7043514.1 DUF4037 domain-containing protein [Virgibacillus sp. M23]